MSNSKRVLLVIGLVLALQAPALAAIVNFTGAETGTTDEVLATGTGATITSSTVKTGTYAYKSLPGTTAQTAYFNVQAATGGLLSQNDMYCTFQFRYVANNNNDPVYAAYNTSGTIKSEVRLTSSGTLDFYQSTAGSGTTGLVSSGSTVLSANTWYTISVRTGTGASSNYEVKINGTSEYASTTDQTATAHGSVRIGKSASRNATTAETYYDDITCDDAAYPTDGVVKVMKPDGNGNYQQWGGASGTGTGFAEVDDLPNDGDTTIVTSDTQNDRFSVSLESTTSAGISASSVNYVKAISICERDGGSNGTFRSFYRIGGTDYDQASNSTSGSTGYIAGGYIRSTDPSDTAAWTTTDLDGLEIGVLDNQVTNHTHCTALNAMVQYVASGGGGGGSTDPSGMATLGVSR